MRLPRFVFFGGLLVLGLGGFVACASDDSGTTPDDPTEAGTTPDGSRPDTSTPPTVDSGAGTDATTSDGAVDAPVDTGTDAKVDTGTDSGVDAGPTTKLYFGGDFAVNNTNALGRALVPVGGTAPATATIAPKASAYALTPDGTKIVFSADVTVAGRADLYVANADGTNAQLRYAMPANTAGISEIVVSPDGNTVAFIADIELDGQLDAYVVPLAGAAAPVRVSPTRAANNADLDAQSIAFSRDSTHLAIAGEFTTNLKNELYTVDLGAAVPVPVPALDAAAIPAPPGTTAVGISTNLRPLWTAGGKVCAKANLEGGAPVFRLYCANADGTAFAEPANFPALPAQLGTYGLSSDGATLAFSADSAAQPGAYEVFTMPSDDSAAPVRITAGTITAVAGTNRGPSFSIPLVFSPDGTRLAYAGDLLVDDRYELFVVALAGGAPEKRLAVVGPANDAERDVSDLVWSPDGLQIAFIADHRVNNDSELFRVLDVTTADQVPSLVRAVVGSGDIGLGIFPLEWRP